MDFRFKRVFKDGRHSFEEIDFKSLASAFTSAAGCLYFDDEDILDRIDVYDDKDKKIATFYK